MSVTVATWWSGLGCVFGSAAIEGSGMGGMKLPVGMTRRALSYDDNLEVPMSTPPDDISINNLWRRPIIPERRFTHLAEVRHTLARAQSHTLTICVLLRRMRAEPRLTDHMPSPPPGPRGW